MSHWLREELWIIIVHVGRREEKLITLLLGKLNFYVIFIPLLYMWVLTMKVLNKKLAVSQLLIIYNNSVLYVVKENRKCFNSKGVYF